MENGMKMLYRIQKFGSELCWIYLFYWTAGDDRCNRCYIAVKVPLRLFEGSDTYSYIQASEEKGRKLKQGLVRTAGPN